MLFALCVTAPRVLIVLKSGSAWSRGILGGFMAAAHERGWTLLYYYNSPSDLRPLAQALRPVAAIVATEFDAPEFSELGPATRVSVAVDRSAENIASVCLDEAAIGKLAYEHLQATGIRDVAMLAPSAAGIRCNVAPRVLSGCIRNLNACLPADNRVSKT
jgi:DNA-binding LacI/PurR family transcriptional regulator